MFDKTDVQRIISHKSLQIEMPHCLEKVRDICYTADCNFQCTSAIADVDG